MEKAKWIIIITFIIVMIAGATITINVLNSKSESTPKIQENTDSSIKPSQTGKNDFQDITQKLLNSQIVSSGIIEKIDENYIYYSDSDSHKLLFKKDVFSYINGRNCKEINILDIKVGDYVYPYNKQIIVFRNISGDELNNELLYNLTLNEDERIMFVNSVEIEVVEIIDDYNATAKITYGDIIGDELTDEKFTTIVEFNADTKYLNRYVNNVKEMEIYSKSNINSVLLKKDSINKKSPAVVLEYEFVED